MCLFLFLSFPILCSPVMMSCSETELFTTAAAPLRKSSAVSDRQKTVSQFVSQNAHLKYLCICSLSLLGQLWILLLLLYFRQHIIPQAPHPHTHKDNFQAAISFHREIQCVLMYSHWPDQAGVPYSAQ